MQPPSSQSPQLSVSVSRSPPSLFDDGNAYVLLSVLFRTDSILTGNVCWPRFVNEAGTMGERECGLST